MTYENFSSFKSNLLSFFGLEGSGMYLGFSYFVSCLSVISFFKSSFLSSFFSSLLSSSTLSSFATSSSSFWSTYSASLLTSICSWFLKDPPASLMTGWPLPSAFSFRHSMTAFWNSSVSLACISAIHAWSAYTILGFDFYFSSWAADDESIWSSYSGWVDYSDGGSEDYSIWASMGSLESVIGLLSILN